MKTVKQLINDYQELIESHPLYCSVCGGWKHASEVICEQCQIDITVENTSIR